MRIFYITLALLLPFSSMVEAVDIYTDKNNDPIPATYHLNDVTIRIAALGCHGSCKTYRVNIFDSGKYKIDIHGKEPITGEIPPMEFYELIGSFYKHRFFAWSTIFSEYHITMTPEKVINIGYYETLDNETFSIGIKIDDFEKFVVLDREEDNGSRWKLYELIASKLKLEKILSELNED